MDRKADSAGRHRRILGIICKDGPVTRPALARTTGLTRAAVWLDLRATSSAGRQCFCGRTGCLEAELGGLALCRILEETGTRKSRDLDSSKLQALAQSGETRVVRLLADSAEALGRHLSPVVFLCSPKYVRVVTCLELDESRLLERLENGLAHAMHDDMVEAMGIALVPDVDAALLKGLCRLAREMFFD